MKQEWFKSSFPSHGISCCCAQVDPDWQIQTGGVRVPPGHDTSDSCTLCRPQWHERL